jgi:ATP-binding cassette subfamily F protein 3
VTMALFDQDQARALDLKRSIFDNAAAAACSKSEQVVRGMLGSFLFSGDMIHKPASALSGGERNRLGMVKTLLQDANLLLLDEPTNHLDIPSKEVLLDALQRYTGTILFVSHDHDFVNNLATHIIILSQTGAVMYQGTYDEYLYQQSVVHSGSMTLKSHEGNNSGQEYKQEQKNRSLSTPSIGNDRKIRAIEQKISRLEKEIATIEQSFVNLVYGTEVFTQTTKQLALSKDALLQATKEWERLHE